LKDLPKFNILLTPKTLIKGITFTDNSLLGSEGPDSSDVCPMGKKRANKELKEQ
jgi:hypothetical protein